ncbi:unnamed protein product [Rotaria sp. Silwood1]|nr:unnamed protein product [Rotaria sp. Silwood1]
MYGATMITMAEAIENSEFVLICMSDIYKQSVYCQSEAHYAFERRCHLIPLIMKPCYKPDGWLGIMLYEMCMINRESMYQSLKSELANVHYRTLTITDYVTFLHEIQRYIPLMHTISQPASSSLPSSTAC